MRDVTQVNDGVRLGNVPLKGHVFFGGVGVVRGVKTCGEKKRMFCMWASVLQKISIILVQKSFFWSN